MAKAGRRDEATTAYVAMRIREWVAAGNGGVTDLAELAGVARSLPTQILNGATGVSGGTVPKFAKVFGFATDLEMIRVAREWASENLPPPLHREPVRSSPDAFSAGAELARFDGALDADVEAARRHPDADDPHLTGGEAYDLIMRTKQRREREADRAGTSLAVPQIARVAEHVVTKADAAVERSTRRGAAPSEEDTDARREASRKRWLAARDGSGPVRSPRESAKAKAAAKKKERPPGERGGK